MANDPVLDDAAIDSALRDLTHWKRDGDALTRSLEFDGFRAAMAFMVRVSYEAEARNHHPEWTNVYNRVEVRLTTHHAGNKITAKDMELAKVIEKVAAG